MPKDHSQPINEADRQARAAVRAYADWITKLGPSGCPRDMNLRTWQRIVSGERDVPPGVAREIAEKLRRAMPQWRHRDTMEGWAMALEIWAEDCQQRSEARHG